MVDTTDIMWPQIHFQPTVSLTLALALFALNLQCPTYAETDARRRQKLVFKILTQDAKTSTLNDVLTELRQTNVTTQSDVSGMPNAIGDGPATGSSRREDIVGETDQDGEPPLVSGSNTKLTLSMMSKFKRTWCKTEPFMQLIKEPGCISRKIMNRFCYGQCNSFYIPKTIRKRTKRKVFKSCGFCKPKRKHTIRVTLKCPFNKKGYKHKKIKQIKECSCMER